MRLKTSLEGRLALLAGTALAVGVGLGVWLAPHLGAGLAIVLSLLATLPLVLVAAHLTWRPYARALRALADGLERLADRDFSAGVAASRSVEALTDVAHAFNALTEVMRDERLTLFQRELLLDTVLQTSPLALLLTDGGERVIYSNPAARQLFGDGHRLEGAAFDTLAAAAPAGLAEAMARERDGLCTVEIGGQSEVFHVSRREFTLNARRHRLYQVKQLTAEISREEVATWKRVIRVISHELNNSLAPMRSLAHSGRTMVAAGGDRREALERVFDTIVDRTEHLGAFIQGYARFAKLPAPRPQAIDWDEFLGRLAAVAPFHRVGGLPATPLQADLAQMEQVMINLLKNALESGGDEDQVEVEIQTAPRHVSIFIRDRGQGMSEETLRSALLPFYSTKRAGSGLGLALCREIVDAHGGRLRLGNRRDGGLEVAVLLPQPLPIRTVGADASADARSGGDAEFTL